MDKKQPGVMLYFDIRPCLNRMSREEQGELFVAILDYAQYGTVPELDGLLGVACFVHWLLAALYFMNFKKFEPKQKRRR